jgi:menaquinone-specific isochorismate synthase
MCGTPTDDAKRFIATHEGYDRGWYSGPFGVVGKDETEFAVAIRCALIHQNLITLFAGSGIVSGSDERSEWSEIEAKISPYLKLLEGEQQHA